MPAMGSFWFGLLQAQSSVFRNALQVGRLS